MASVGVAAVRLDKLLATSSGTDLMRQLVLKVDVEGLESQVLMSLGAEFEPQKTPIIVCEFGSEGLRAAMSSPELLLKMALDRGYCCLNITDGLWVSNSLELPPFRNYIVKNFVFIHANLMEVVDSFVRLRTDNQFSADRSDLMQVPRS